MTFTRRDAARLLEETGLPPSVARRVADGFFGLIIEALRQGRTVRLKNFATFQVRTLPERKIHDARTGSHRILPPRRKVHATFSKSLKARLNAEAGENPP